MAGKIEQPDGMLLKKGDFGASLEWNRSFAADRTESFSKAQAFVDSECIRLMGKYTPERNRAMIRSATLGTKIGSGRIIYASPYARYQYYGKLMVSSITGSSYARSGEKKVLTDKNLKYTKGSAQLRWFEVTKANHGRQILMGAARIAGGKVK